MLRLLRRNCIKMPMADSTAQGAHTTRHLNDRYWLRLTYAVFLPGLDIIAPDPCMCMS
jgi:hypothetical protein